MYTHISYTPRDLCTIFYRKHYRREFYSRRNTVINVRRHLSKVNRIHGGALFSQTRDSHRRAHACTLLSLYICCFALDRRYYELSRRLLIIHLDEIDYHLGSRLNEALVPHFPFINSCKVYFAFKTIFRPLLFFFSFLFFSFSFALAFCFVLSLLGAPFARCFVPDCEIRFPIFWSVARVAYFVQFCFTLGLLVCTCIFIRNFFLTCKNLYKIRST